jgi:hypothetical protein
VSGPRASPARASAEVGQVVGVAAVEATSLDLDADQLADAVDSHGDGSAGDGAVDGGLGQPGLGVLQLLLHLLRLLEQGVHVEAACSAECLEGVLAHGDSRFSRGSGGVTGGGPRR